MTVKVSLLVNTALVTAVHPAGASKLVVDSRAKLEYEVGQLRLTSLPDRARVKRGSP